MVPRLLTEKQKAQRLNACRDILQQMEADEKPHHRRWVMDLSIWSGNKTTRVVSGKVCPCLDQRKPACNIHKWKWCWSPSLTIREWCITSLFLKGKQLTNTFTRKFWLVFSTKFVKSKELPGQEKLGSCITTMLLPTQPSAWNSFWSQKKSPCCIIHLICRT